MSEHQSIYDVNMETGDLVNEPDVPLLCAGLTDDELLTAISAYRAAEACYRDARQRAEAELTKRLQARQATVYVSDRWDVKLTPQVEYKYDTVALGQLTVKALISGEEWGKVIDWTPKISKVELNKLAKRGGEVREIIEAAITAIPKAPRLEIKAVEQ